MAFGAGALVSALAFDLTEEAFNTATLRGRHRPGAGALTFYFGNRLIDEARRGKRVEPAESSNGLALALGALLDGIPESVVLGSTLLGGATISVPFLAAVAISNLPEAISAATDLKREGRRRLDHARCGSSWPWPPAWLPPWATACSATWGRSGYR